MSKHSSVNSNVTGETSNSTRSDYPSQIKIPRPDGNFSPKFKGVVSQPRGRWGAQIYATQQRIWLGTFKSENEAAMAYDSAAIKIRRGDSYRNFPWNSATAHEPTFQSLFSTETVLNMIKDGSYPAKFAEYLNSQFQAGKIKAVENFAVPTIVNGEYLCRQIFQKELTPSDVGSLNRLVIPKKKALKYFPHITENEKGDQLMLFYDMSMRSWRFRYCYWKSSQSFVFTKGWNKFVKVKELKAKDEVVFFSCDRGDGSDETRMIDVVYHGDDENRNNDVIHEVGQDHKASCLYSEENCDDADEPERKENLVNNVESSDANKGIRLFGVQLI